MNPSKKLEESTVFDINTLDLPVSKSINSFQILSVLDGAGGGDELGQLFHGQHHSLLRP